MKVLTRDADLTCRVCQGENPPWQPDEVRKVCHVCKGSGLRPPTPDEYQTLLEDRNRCYEALEELVGVFEGTQVDYSDCPYYKKDGSEGAYGPNTCAYGCVEEPACIEGDWPVERARVLLDAKGLSET